MKVRFLEPHTREQGDKRYEYEEGETYRLRRREAEPLVEAGVCIQDRPPFDIQRPHVTRISSTRDEETEDEGDAGEGFECGEETGDGTPCTRPVGGPEETCHQHP